MKVFIFGQTQEQLDSDYNFKTEYNKVIYNRIINQLKDISEGEPLTVITSADRGLGMTAAISCIAIKNESTFIDKANLEIAVPNYSFVNGWDRASLEMYDRIVDVADSVRSASRADTFTGEDWIRLGKYMVDNSSLGILGFPNIKPNWLKEVIRYGIAKNCKLLKITENGFEEVTLIDAMI